MMALPLLDATMPADDPSSLLSFPALCFFIVCMGVIQERAWPTARCRECSMQLWYMSAELVKMQAK